MEAIMDFVIYHDGKNWCLANDLLSVSASAIDALDAELTRVMRQQGLIKTGERKKVRMLFDNSTLPPVIRQYAQHYFNRVVEIEG